MPHRHRKAISPLLAGALYIGIISAAIILVVEIGGPAIVKMQDVAALEQAKDALSNLDRVIGDVASEGTGSTRLVPVQIKKGNIFVESATDKTYYSLDTKAELISPRTRKDVGNMFFSSNANVEVTDSGTEITVENEHWRVVFNKTGNSSEFAPINTSALIKSIYLKDAVRYLNATISVEVDADPASAVGNGYVYAQKTGKGLARGTVIAHVNNTAADYNLYFTLESGRDHFSEVAVRDYHSHL